MSDYRTVFEVTYKAFPIWFPGLGLVLIALGTAFWRFPKWRSFAAFFVLFGILWIGGVGFRMYPRFGDAKADYMTHNYQEVEGTIEDFHPMPSSGHDEESFLVGNHRFSYSNFTITPCYNATTVSGGQLRDGLHVRLAFKDDCILRVQIRQ